MPFPIAKGSALCGLHKMTSLRCCPWGPFGADSLLKRAAPITPLAT